MTQALLPPNTIMVKLRRSYVGKAQNVAGVIHIWRPFLSSIWGAVGGTDRHSGAPPGHLWTKQIADDLKWILAFLKGTKGSITRSSHLDQYTTAGPRVFIVTDASPWGLGAWIKIDENVLEY